VVTVFPVKTNSNINTESKIHDTTELNKRDTTTPPKFGFE